MKPIDFQGFRFGRIHTSDLHLEVVSSSDRYEARTLPNPTDTATDVPGSDGQYYFGSIYKNREITCNVAFNNLSENDYRKIRQVFSTDKLQDLVFDEEPYKTWRAKLKSKPDFKSLCFTDKETGQRVYKGDGKLNFICYYPYAYGFDKYVVRAADYYTLTPPECIIKESYSDETYVKNSKHNDYYKELPEDTKYHYNSTPSDYEGGSTDDNVKNNRFRDNAHKNKLGRAWEPNSCIWKSGYPTYEQVVAGELFFDTPQGEKTIVDVRSYWDNVPEWQISAKLLTTPTLDYEQELIYLPQYSKTDFINMETGFQSGKAMIGSRLLVYNPGDVPVEWELKFNENKRSFWSCRGGTKFRISRFNVQRLQLENAVDWCGLKTYEEEDNDYWKYGIKYFKRRTANADQIIKNINQASDEDLIKIYKAEEDISGMYNRTYNKAQLIKKIQEGNIPFDKQWEQYDESLNNGVAYSMDYKYTDNSPYTSQIAANLKTAFNTHLDEWSEYLSDSYIKSLGNAHPKHCYYVEPIPKEKLGHYIKLFYWQTIQWRGDRLNETMWQGTERYKEFLKDCLDENGNIIDVENPLIQMSLMFANIVDINGNKKLVTSNDNSYRYIYKDLDFEDGIALADRYEELYELCITDEERYELYWETLKQLLSLFTPLIKESYYMENENNIKTFDNVENMIDEFIYSYINKPSEFIGFDGRDLDYADDIFNGYKMPTWITNDYLEIDQMALSGVETIKTFLDAVGEGYDKIFTGNRRIYTQQDRDYLVSQGIYTKLINTLDSTIGVNGILNDLLDDKYYLNTDNRMLYTTANPYGAEFVYKPNKVVMNDAITKGKWFKLPPGWSLICIEPVVDESIWGGKRWEDSRPFDWGYGGDKDKNKREVQQLFDYVYEQAKKEFFSVYPKSKIYNGIVSSNNIVQQEGDTTETVDDNELVKFRTWYEQQITTHEQNKNYFAKTMYNKYRADAEYEFLKIIHSIWTVLSPYFAWSAEKGVYFNPDYLDTNFMPTMDDYDITGRPLRCINGDISDWWWYACNYLWANFPPLYWGVADMLNDIQIKYTPLFY